MEVLRERGREIFRQIKAPGRRNTGSISGFRQRRTGGKDPASTRYDFRHGLLGDNLARSATARGERRLDVLAQLGLVALAVALLGRALFSSKVFYYRDISAYWYPLIEAFVRTVASGEWPLWNPSLGFGHPMLEDPNLQVAYPPTWLNLILPPALYYKLFVVTHLAWGALGAYRLGRRLELRADAAFVGAAIFLASGPWLSGISLWHHFAGVAWLPWLWLAVERVLSNPSRHSGAVLGCVAAAQALTGSADLCVMGGLGAAARIACSRGLRDRTAPVVRAFMVAIGLAALLGAVQWLPTLGIINVGVRSGMGTESSAYWSLHPVRLVELVLPRLLVDLPLSQSVRDTLLESREAFLRSIYIGAPAAGLAVLALLTKGPQRLLAAGFLAFLAIALGRYTPVYGAILELPPVAMLRFPIKFLWPGALLWGLLVGFGFRALGRPWPTLLRRRVRGLALLLSLVGLSLLVSEARGFGAGALAELLDSRASAEVRAAALEAAGRTIGLGGALLLATGALLGLRSRREASNATLSALFALLVVGDVAFAGWSTYRLAPAELLRHRPQLLDTIASTRLPRVYARKAARERVLESLLRGSGEHASALSWLLGDLERLRPPAASRWGVDGSYQGDFTGLAPQVAGQMDALVARAWGRPLGRRLLEIGSVTHAVALSDWGPGAPPQVASLASVFSEPIRMFELSTPIPRAYVVSGARVAAEPDSFDLLQQPDFDPRAETLLAPPAEGRPVSAEFSGVVELLWRRANSVGIRAELSTPGYVVLTDAHWPGWKATVDGAPTPIHRANVLFRAVGVGPGQHMVEFRYAPPLVPWGVAASLLGVAIVALIGLPRRRRSNVEA